MPEAPDRLIELYQQAAEEDLKARRRFEQRLASAERRKQKKAGHLGELCVTLDIPRHYWPAVHEAAIRHSIPIQTARLPRGVVSPVCITTTESGALRLRASVPALQAAEGTP